MGTEQISIIKIKDYIDLDIQTKSVIDYTIQYALRDSETLKVGRKYKQPIFKDIFSLKWEQLIELQELVKDKNVKGILQMLYKITDKQFLNLDVYNCFAVYKFVLSKLKELSKIEERELSVEPTQEQKNAGIEELNRFGYYNNLDFLAGGDVLKYDELLNMSYSIIFRKLVLEKIKSDINTNYINNVSRQAKRN